MDSRLLWVVKAGQAAAMPKLECVAVTKAPFNYFVVSIYAIHPRSIPTISTKSQALLVQYS